MLDEATSALDSESEALVQEALENLMRGRTSIVVAHRLSTVAALDRIVVLADGEIVEDGTHAELAAAGGEYAALWNRQTGAFLDGQAGPRTDVRGYEEAYPAGMQLTKLRRAPARGCESFFVLILGLVKYTRSKTDCDLQFC